MIGGVEEANTHEGLTSEEWLVLIYSYTLTKILVGLNVKRTGIMRD